MIPELEALIGTVQKHWTEDEDAILRRYYGKVPRDALLKHLKGRTVCSLQHRAQALGLTTTRKVVVVEGRARGKIR